MSENSPTGDNNSRTPSATDSNMDLTTVAIVTPAVVPYEMRNAEEYHNVILARSQQYSNGVRRYAEAVLANHLLTERLDAIQLECEQEEEKARLQLEITTAEKRKTGAKLTQINAERERIEAEGERMEAERKKVEAEIKVREKENALKQMPAIPPPIATPPAASSSAQAPSTSTNTQGPSSSEQSASQSATQSAPAAQAQAQAVQTPTQPPRNPFAQSTLNTASPSTQATTAGPSGTNSLAPSSQTPAPAVAAPQNATQPPTRFSDMVDQPGTEKYISIHIQLKMLRQQVKPKGKQNTSPFKDEAMRQISAIRIALGQLSTSGNNAHIHVKLRDIMKGALTYQVDIGQGPQVLLMDPSPYVVRVPEPNDTAKINGDQLPVFFIYLLSVFSKALIAQATGEAAVKSEAAEPLALAAHQIFSHPDLLWRGMSMIDILVAKLRKSCGTLFGFRGAETKDTGRVTLGWKKEDGIWISEAYHYDRMRGIGAFYAGLTLRLYKNRVNPYPPHHYWRAMSAILSCPQQERSNTSYYVLAALIKGYEQKFFQFYGDMARDALYAALVQYPQGAKEKNVAVMTLLTLGEKLQQEGFYLQA